MILEAKFAAKYFAGAAVLLCGIYAVLGADLRVVPGHVPPVVSSLTPKGRLAATNELSLAIGLASRDEQGLDAFIQQLYDPASTNYHHYLTPAQFAGRFGPAQEDYQAVIDFAKTNGLNVTQQYSNCVVLDVKGPVAAIEKSFHVTLRTYQHPTEARLFYAPDVEPSLPAELPVQHISGLENYSLPYPKHTHRSPGPGDKATPNGVAPKVGSAPNGDLWGNDFRDAYVPGTTLSGTGQNLGLLEFQGFYGNDITNYENAIWTNITYRPQLVIVPVEGGITNPLDDNGPECAGDIEVAVSMAPGMSNIYVFENSYGEFDDVFESMVTYTNILQFSCSWGSEAGSDATSELLFKQMAAQGQSFYDASGDTGAFVGSVDFPADSPSIVQVGGTTMTNGSAPSYPWQSEVVWNWGTDSSGNHEGNGDGASGGGVSTHYTIPSWQTNLSMVANKGSTTLRNIPDVAANADNYYIYSNDGTQSGGWAGTSFAAPLWASFTALVNQQAAACGDPPVGFPNPALYALAAGNFYTNCFHDITSGSNIWKSSPTKFYAVAGYDLCTGLGTMNGTNLINALAPLPSAPSFLPPARDAGQVVLTWTTVTNRSYQLQYAATLNPASWTNLGSATNASGATATATDSFTNSQRFYRVLLVP